MFLLRVSETTLSIETLDEKIVKRLPDKKFSIREDSQEWESIAKIKK